MEDTTETHYSIKETRDRETGKVLREVFFEAHGEQDMTNVYKIVDYDLETGNPIEERYFKDGVLHRDDGPARVIRESMSGMVSEEFWLQNGMLHRDNEFPAHTVWNMSSLSPFHHVGDKESEGYYVHGEKTEWHWCEFTAEG